MCIDIFSRESGAGETISVSVTNILERNRGDGESIGVLIGSGGAYCVGAG
jgi:hypothetical protein